MNRYLQEMAIVAMLGGALLTGCATATRAEKKAGRPGERRVEKFAEPGSEAGEEALERRVRAVAHFAAGISAELNDDDSVALDHYLKSATADPGHEVLVLEWARRSLQNRQLDTAIDLSAKATASPRA